MHPFEKQRFDVSLEDIQTFLAVANLGSFSTAASRLSLSQPSVSNRVRRLEEKLGVRLLDRTTRKVGLTSDGFRLHAEASITLRALTDLLRDFGAQAQARRLEVNVAATLSVATVALPPIVGAFTHQRPDLAVRLHDMTPADAVNAVLEGHCDIGVLVVENVPDRLIFEPLLRDTCVVITPLHHPLLDKGGASLAQVLEYEILSTDQHIGLRQAINSAAEERGLDVKLASTAISLSNVITLLAMTVAGLGLCIHPRSLIPAELRPLVGIVELSDCAIPRTFGLLTSRDRPLSLSARAFCDHLRKTVTEGSFGWSSATA